MTRPFQEPVAVEDSFAGRLRAAGRGEIPADQEAVGRRSFASGLFEPKVVYGYFPAQSDGNDVVVYEPEDASGRDSPRELLRFTFPRQREGRKLCISDFFLPKSSGKIDVLGLSLVTIGSKASVETQRLFEAGEYTKYLYLHGLSVETAEALAEYSSQENARRIGHLRR